MFAYCNNNPIRSVDSAGTLPINSYYVDFLEANLVGKAADGSTVYVINSTYTVVTSDTMSGFISSYSDSFSITFTVSTDGFIQFDNNQASAGMILIAPIGKAIANEILDTINTDFGEDFLFGRTANGLLFEMVTHYTANMLGAKVGPSHLTDMGSISIDKNALAFESPLKHPDLWIEMLF